MRLDRGLTSARTRFGRPMLIGMGIVLALSLLPARLNGEEQAKLPDLSAATQKAQQALDRPIDIELNAATLEAALGRIALTTGCSIRIDLPTFMGRRINLSQPVPARIRGDSLRAAFDQLCAPESGEPAPALPVSGHEGAIQIDGFRWAPYPRSGAFQQGRYVVNGRVVDEAGRPAGGAIVRLYCWAWVMLATTDDDGKFFATLPTNGNLVIEARDADGERRGWSHSGRDGGGEGPRLLSPTLTLKPPKQVMVRVTDETQKPIEGARVVLIGAGFPYDTRTSAAGEATLQVPADLESDSVFAWKDGIGMDYTATRDSSTSAGPGGPPLNTDQPIALQLSRGSPVRVRIVDEADKPIAGHSLAPWVLRKHGAPHSFNTTHFHGSNQIVTDQNGELTFDWPAWQTESVSFSGGNPRYSRAQMSLTAADAKSKTQTIPLQRYAALRGQVLGLEGEPARDVYVIARGLAGKERDPYFAGNGVADTAGRFEFFVPAHRPYQVVALTRDGKEISQPEERYVEDVTRDTDDLALYLRPAIRVFGRVAPRDTGRDDSQPRLRLVGEDWRTRPDVKLLAADSLTPIRATEDIQIAPQPDGSFSVLVGPGRYEFLPTKDAAGVPFELTDQREYQVAVPPM